MPVPLITMFSAGGPCEIPWAVSAPSRIAGQPRTFPQFEQCRSPTARCFPLPPQSSPESQPDPAGDEISTSGVHGLNRLGIGFPRSVDRGSIEAIRRPVCGVALSQQPGPHGSLSSDLLHERGLPGLFVRVPARA